MVGALTFNGISSELLDSEQPESSSGSSYGGASRSCSSIYDLFDNPYLRSNHLGYIDDKLNQKITGNTTETTLFQVKIPKIFSPPSAARNSQLSVDSEDMPKGVPFAVQKSPENLINSIFLGCRP